MNTDQQVAADRERVDVLADEFLQRFRQGERPAITDYVQAHPDLAAEIRDLFPTLVVLERFGPRPEDLVNPPAAGPPESMPQRLGEYRIVREVGRGGMGVVYEAVQESLGRHVALKVLPSHALMDSLRLKRFQHEAQAAARLHHTNIVPVFGVGTEGGVHFYAMQFIQGRGLNEIIDEVRRLKASIPADGSKSAGDRAALSPDDDTPVAANLSTLSDTPRYYRSVARLGAQVADALEHAHRLGILHRDIKPANLLLDSLGTVWVTDFGLAKAAGMEELTQTGDVIGTLRYTAPERLRGEGDARADVCSLGLTLYELLTLRPAFDASDRISLVRQISQDEPPRPRKLDPRIPRDLETIVVKAIAKEPERRYATAGELADDLRRFLGDRPIEARRTPWWEHAGRWCRRNPAVAVSSALGLAALLIGLGVALWQWDRAKYNYAQAKASAAQALTSATQAQASAAQAKASATQSQEDVVLALQAIDQMMARVGNDYGISRELITQDQRSLRAEALRFYQALLEGRENSHSLPVYEVARAHWRLAQIHGELKNDQVAVEHQAHAQALVNVLLAAQPERQDHRRLAAHIEYRQGAEWVRQSEKTKAEECFRRSLSLWTGLCNEFPNDYGAKLGVGQVVTELAALLRKHERHAETEPLLRQAIDVLEKPFADDAAAHYRLYYLAHAFNQITPVMEASGQQEQAEQKMRRAVALFEKSVQSRPGTSEQNLLAMVRGNLAQLLARKGVKGDEPERLFQQAIETSRRLAAASPDVLMFRQTLAERLAGFAERLDSRGQDSEARRTLEESLTHWKYLIEQNSDDGQQLYRHQRLGDVLESLALKVQADNPTTARALLEEAIGHQQLAIQTNPPDPVALANLAKHYANLVSLLDARKDLGAAEPFLAEQLALAEKLSSEHGEERFVRIFQAWAFENLAHVRLQTNQLVEAANAYQKAVDVRRKLAADYPNDPRSAMQLGTILGISSRVHRKEGKWPEMLVLVEEALGYHEAAVKEQPYNQQFAQMLVNEYMRLAQAHTGLKNHRQVAEDAKICGRFPNLVNEYEWAIFLARSIPLAEQDQELAVEERNRLIEEYGNQALKLLQAAERKKAKELSRLATDAAFKPLRGRQDFQKLLSAVKLPSP